MTVSLGVTGKHAEMEDKNQLLALADQCLLSAKQQGRNRVVSLQSLIDSGRLPGDKGASDSGLDNVLARDVMIPLSHCLNSDWPIVRAAAYFLQYRVSSAPVTDADGNLLGIVSEQDVLAIAHDPQAPDRHVNEVMRSNVITYEDDASLAQILSFLTRAAMRSVVITSAGKPCGLISRAAIVRWFLDNRWKVGRLGDTALQHDANGDATADGESTLLNLAGQLAEEADRLHRFLQCPRPDHDTVPIIGGASRMQQLIGDLLAGSASGNRTGGGLPF